MIFQISSMRMQRVSTESTPSDLPADTSPILQAKKMQKLTNLLRMRMTLQRRRRKKKRNPRHQQSSSSSSK